MTTTLTPLETLRAARQLITPPERWTTRTLARDAEGNSVRDTDPDATCWCAVGAIRHVLGLDDNLPIPDAVWDPIDRVVRARRKSSIATINDYQGGHPAVLDVFDTAIAELEAGAVR
jgi:hypothetical protein